MCQFSPAEDLHNNNNNNINYSKKEGVKINVFIRFSLLCTVDAKL